MKGYIQVYTGNGKGKTTAALGLALRAAGAGLRIFFAQFMKGLESGEVHALEKLSDNITFRQYGSGSFIIGTPKEEDIRACHNGLKEAGEAMLSGRYNIIVLDEANVAVRYKLLETGELREFIGLKPDDVELVITGRDADPAIIEEADLVTEMKEVKHYYAKGVPARTGIEK